MQLPVKLTTGTAAGGGAALLLAGKLTIITMWLFGISDAKAPFEVIDAATTVITSFWAVALTLIGGVIAHFVPTQAKEEIHARLSQGPVSGAAVGSPAARDRLLEPGRDA